MKESTIATIFSQDGDKVLLLKRRDVPIWVLPGGSLEKCENPAEGVVREVYEETGLHVAVTRKVALYSPINRLAATTHLFDCKVVQGELTTGDETADIGFFTLNQLPKDFFYIHKDMLNDALSHESHILFKSLENVTYWALIRYFLRHPIQVIRFALSQLGLPINSQTP